MEQSPLKIEDVTLLNFRGEIHLKSRHEQPIVGRNLCGWWMDGFHVQPVRLNAVTDIIPISEDAVFVRVHGGFIYRVILGYASQGFDFCESLSSQALAGKLKEHVDYYGGRTDLTQHQVATGVIVSLFSTLQRLMPNTQFLSGNTHRERSGCRVSINDLADDIHYLVKEVHYAIPEDPDWSTSNTEENPNV